MDDDISGMHLFWLQCTMSGILYQDTFLSLKAWNWNPGKALWLQFFLVSYSSRHSTSRQNMVIRDGWSCLHPFWEYPMATLLSVSLQWHPKVTRLVDIAMIACYIMCSKYRFPLGSSWLFMCSLFCRDLSKMPWAICLCCVFYVVYLQGLLLIGYGS